MKISIITIHRNNPEGLRRTLASVAGQLRELRPGRELEYVVVDGESAGGLPEDCADRLSELGATVLTRAPRGVYDAINEGLRAATGDIVGLLHAGDVFAVSATADRIADVFEWDSVTDYVYGDVTIGRRHYSGDNFTRERALTGFAPPHPSLYLRREAARRLGDYDVGLRVAADFEYFLRLLNDSSLKGVYVPEVFVEMETGGMSQRLSNRLWHNNTERLAALRKHGMPASRLRLLGHYGSIIKGFMKPALVCSSKKK